MFEEAWLLPFLLTGILTFLAGLSVAAVFYVRKSSEVRSLESDLATERQKSSDREERLFRLEELNTNLEQNLKESQRESVRLDRELVIQKTTVEKERESFQKQLETLQRAEVTLKDTFQSLSSQALRSNNTAFLELANTTFSKLRESAQTDLESRKQAISELVKPINEGLKNVDERIIEMEKGRSAQVSTVAELIQNLAQANEQTRLETQNLVAALRAPNIRGQWGELQLRRTIEIAGMLKYCDFVEQESVHDGSRSLRPDVVIRLPNNRRVVVDSKAPLAAYLHAHESTDPDVRASKLKEHALHIRNHLKLLGQKSYQSSIEESPEFVVMFLPGEVFFSAALEHDASLIEYGVDMKVLIATPTTLIALLKAIAYGWQNQEIAEKAGEIIKAGRDLHDSVVVMLTHLGNMRKNLANTVEAFNRTISSTEKRLLPRVRRFKKLNADSGKSIPEVGGIEGHLQEVNPPALEMEEDSES